MARPATLLLLGIPDPWHHRPEHYELVAGLLAGPAGLNLTVAEGFQPPAGHGVRDYALLVLWGAGGRQAPEAVQALFEAVRQGTPLLALHAATTVGHAIGAPEALGVRYLHPHLPYQELAVDILDGQHPITAGVAPFRVRDEPYRLDPAGDGVHVLAGYDAAQARLWRVPAAPLPEAQARLLEEAQTWVAQQRPAPLLYTTRWGAGKVHGNALGHDRAALAHPAFRRLVTQAVAWLLA